MLDVYSFLDKRVQRQLSDGTGCVCVCVCVGESRSCDAKEGVAWGIKTGVRVDRGISLPFAAVTEPSTAMPDQAARRAICNTDHVLQFVQAFCAEKFVCCDEQVLALCGYRGNYNQMKKLFQRQLKRTTAPFAIVKSGRREYYVLHVLHFQLVLVRMRSYAAKQLYRLLSDALVATTHAATTIAPSVSPLTKLCTIGCTPSAGQVLLLPQRSATFCEKQHKLQQQERLYQMTEYRWMVNRQQQQHHHHHHHQEQQQQPQQQHQLQQLQQQQQQHHHLQLQQQHQHPHHLQQQHHQYHPQHHHQQPLQQQHQQRLHQQQRQHRHEPTLELSRHVEHHPSTLFRLALWSSEYRQPFETGVEQQSLMCSSADVSLSAKSSRPIGICKWSIETTNDGKTLFSNFSS